MRKLSLLFILVLALSDCSKHGDMPAQLPIIVPPVPGNFTVDSCSNGVYSLSWDVSDPAVVSHYRIYTVDSYFGPSFADTTSATSIQITIINLPGVCVPGLTWGVTSVTIENIESRMAYAITVIP